MWCCRYPVLEGRGREFLTDEDGFRSGRAGPATPEAPLLDDSLRAWFNEWRRRSWDTAVAVDLDCWTPPQEVDRTHAELTFAPALLLRPRGQSGLLRMYEAIGAELAHPDRPISVGLANLVAPAAAARPAAL
jgi:hypothetical protein